MGVKRVILPFLTAAILIISCKTTPPVVEDPGLVEFQADTGFNQSQITREYRDSTMNDVRLFIEELNGIIRRRDYNAWKNALSDEYFAEISSKEHLQMISEQPAMKTRRVVVRTAEDYFRLVVVPSRGTDSRVDDIEFLSMTRVKAFTIMKNNAGEDVRLRLYDLEKFGNVWKIIN
jgi:hypothetical protein